MPHKKLVFTQNRTRVVEKMLCEKHCSLVSNERLTYFDLGIAPESIDGETCVSGSGISLAYSLLSQTVSSLSLMT